MNLNNKLLYNITNLTWNSLAYKLTQYGINDYIDLIGVNYTFDPITDHVFTNNSSLFEPKKALAMWLWYKKGDRKDKSIIDIFNEYKHCINNSHPYFYSNYGYYAFTKGLLDLCIQRLCYNQNTRQAMFCINNNNSMCETSIDKLCTNTIHFFMCTSGEHITLEMIVQMRSSNFLTLLPYDAFMFTMFYGYVFNALIHTYPMLITGKIRMQVASLHLYKNDIEKIEKQFIIDDNIIGDFTQDKNWITATEENLIKNIR